MSLKKVTNVSNLRYRTMRNFLIFILTFFAGEVLAQTDTSLIVREKQLASMLTELRAAKTDDEKSEKNEVFKNYLYQTLEQKGAYSYSFSLLKTVGFVDSPDGLLRIVNWNIEQEDQSQVYYCFLMRLDPKKKNIKISELVDNSAMLPPRPDGVLEANDWYGALYYKIVPLEKGSKTLYTLLGWDGNSSMSTIKLIDALYFSGDNPKLGSPVFKVKDVTQKRVFFEHSKKAVMSLKYEDEYKRLIFDHLSPETPSLTGFYSFYIPDFTYDAFVLEGNKWILYEDVIAVNKGEEEKTDVFVKNERTGKVEKKEIKNKWQNPEDEKAPGGGNKHVAVTPDMDVKNPVAEKKELEKKVDKRDKRDPSNLNSTYGTNKKRKKSKS